MAQITWRDVAAPDFSTALKGYGDFSRTINTAFDGLKTAVNNFDQAKSAEINNRFALALAQAGSPEAIRQGVVNGNIAGFSLDPSQVARLSQENLKAISPESLLSLTGSQQKVDEAKLAAQHAAALDANAGAIANVTAGLASTDPVTRGLAAVAARTLPFDKLGGGFAKNFAGENQRLVDTAVRTDRSQFDNAVAKRDDAVQTVGYDYAAKVAPGVTNQAEADLVLNQDPEFAKLNGREQAAVRSRISSLLQNAAGSGTPASAGAASGAAGGFSGAAAGGAFNMGDAEKTVASTFKNAGMSDAVIAGFLGNFSIEGGYDGAVGDKGTAGGIAQWREKRRDAFIARNGVDPTQASHEVQAKHVLWELTTPEGRAAAGITDQQAREILDAKTPGEAASLIDQYYERSDKSARSSRISAAESAANVMAGRFAEQSSLNQLSQTNANSFATQWKAAATDVRDVTQVATDLIKTDFTGKGVDRGKLIGYLERIQAEGKKAGIQVSPAEAAAILKNSTQEENWFLRLLPGEALGQGTKINWKDVKKNIADVESGAVQKVNVSNQTVIQSQSLSTGYRDQVLAAEANLRRLQELQANGRVINPVVMQNAERQVQTARGLYASALIDQQSGTPDRFKPVAAAPPPPKPVSAPPAKPVIAGLPPGYRNEGGKIIRLTARGLPTGDNRERRLEGNTVLVKNGRGVWVRES